MRKILFVDDEPNVIEDFKSKMGPIQSIWDVSFASSGEDALKVLAETPDYDVIISDIDMPNMDGAELLSIVMEEYPDIVRIVLSDHSGESVALKTIKSAHQFLLKPCDLDIMLYTIERPCKLRDLLKNDSLRRMITGIRDLPSLPSLYGLIVKEMNSPSANLKKVGYIISQDVSMSAKILQIINSAYFGLPKEIVDPQQAAIYLGIDTLKALVLSIHVFSTLKEESEFKGFSLGEMWKHSLMTGSLARDIARSILSDQKVLEEALIAGLLHDIGKLILLKLPGKLKRIIEFSENNRVSFVEAEYAIIKTSHAELGAYLLGLWGISGNVVETVAFHHYPSKLLEDMLSALSTSYNNSGNRQGFNENKRPQSTMEYLTGLTTLSAVHVSNALMMQKNCSSDTTIFPYIDKTYLKTLNLYDRLSEWAYSCGKIKQERI